MASRAQAKAAELFPGDANEGRRSAFRHAYWSALMTYYISAPVAKDFGDAHEYANFDPQVSIDRAYNNNEKGRDIGQRLGPGGTLNPYEIEAAVLSILNGGKLDTRIAVGEPNRWAPPSR